MLGVNWPHLFFVNSVIEGQVHARIQKDLPEGVQI